MAAPATPSTPDNTPKRSFTAPIRVAKPGTPSSSKVPTEGSPEGSVETLYTHPDVKIFKFQTSASGLSSGSPGRPQSSSGSLPWATPAERTIAAGPLEIYHVLGSMTMLRSGKLLHPLLPRSQCWCVDGASKFVIRASIDTYYRIELPAETDEELEKVEQLKETLQKRIFYERTPCPFARTFTVDLPEEQPEPRKKRRRHTEGKAKKWRLDHAYGWRPEGWEPGMDEPEQPEDESGSASTSGSENESSSSGEAEESSPVPQTTSAGPSMRARAMQALRSASMPQQISSQRTRPTRRRTKADADETADREESVAGAEQEQEKEVPMLRTFQAIPTDMPPSPPDSSAGLDYSEAHMPTEGWVDIERTVEVPLVAHEELDAAKEDQQPEPEASIAHDEDDSSDEPVTGDISGREEDIDDSVHTVIISTPLAEKEAAATAIEEPEEDEAETDEPAEIFNPPEIASPSDAAGEEQEIAPLETDRSEEVHASDEDDLPATPSPPRRTNSDDPYAAIQARILARRSLSGTTSFHPLHKSPSRGSSSSHSSAATIISNRASRSNRSLPQHEDLATALVKRVYSVFLGPPAHLVALMLKIAARFASGAFGVDGMFHVESPMDSPRRPPGSYQLQMDGEHVQAVEIDSDDDEGWEDDEDDFGVKLNRSGSEVSGLRERKGFEID